MNEKGKWIITDNVDPLAIESLEAMGKHVDYHPDISDKDLLGIIDRYEGIMISSKTSVHRQLIDRAAQLKIVARLGSGMEHIDTTYCESKNISCLNSPEGNCNAVAEHAFGMLLALSNRILTSHNELLEQKWEREHNRGFELKGLNAGIIGYGHTGSAFVRKFLGWGVNVFAYDKYKSGFGNDHVTEAGYEELINTCDIISFHIPYNAETHHWINKSFISSCKPGVILINTSRGAIANTPDLSWGLESGQIGGLCLDVFEDEPLSTQNLHSFELYRELLLSDRVIATPHIAGWSRESKVLLIKTLISKIDRTLKKQSTQ